MLRAVRLLIAAIVLSFALAPAAARAQAVAGPGPTPPDLDARAFLLLDYDSGQVLAASRADERMEPASLTKMMTAHIVFDEVQAGRIALGDMVTISEKAWRTGGSRMFVEVGKQVSVENLLKGLIIQSGNDASVALAEFIAGDETAFAGMMNRAAERLGMRGSHFVNATGLPDADHYVTAADLAKLAVAMVREHPQFYSWHAIRSYQYNDITQYNRNKLLWRDDSVDGIKTGHTESAGYCLVASAKRDAMRLISVVMGSGSEESRADASQALLNWGFRFFETHHPFRAGSPLVSARVWKGAEAEVDVVPLADVVVTVPRGRYADLGAELKLDDPLLAPLAAGQNIGTVEVTLDGQLVASAPVGVGREVAAGGFFSRLVDGLRLALR